MVLYTGSCCPNMDMLRCPAAHTNQHAATPLGDKGRHCCCVLNPKPCCVIVCAGVAPAPAGPFTAAHNNLKDWGRRMEAYRLLLQEDAVDLAAKVSWAPCFGCHVSIAGTSVLVHATGRSSFVTLVGNAQPGCRCM
jgi:hypothetical protein